jgi:hypothetical protein
VRRQPGARDYVSFVIKACYLIKTADDNPLLLIAVQIAEQPA